MTTNEPATIDDKAFTVSRSITILAPIEKVWAAITEPEHIAQWAGQAAELSALEVGGTAVWTWDKYGAVPLVIEELDPPHMIAYRWGSAGETAVDPEVSTQFRFTLESTPEGTRLSVVESGFDRKPDARSSMEGNQQGWTHELDELVAYVEALA